MFADWFPRIALCIVLLIQIPGSGAELIVSAAEGEIGWFIAHLIAVLGDVYFCYWIIRDGLE